MSAFPRIAATSFVSCSLLLSAAATEDFAFFEKEVRPVLVSHCYECHSEEAGKQKGGLWLDRREGWEQGGDSGPSVIPGDVEGSLLIETVRYLEPSLQMPPKTRLSKEEIEVLEKWIAIGAPDPRDSRLAGALRKEAIDYDAARREWAYRPLEPVEVPASGDSHWARTAVDSFIEAGLDSMGLRPAPDAPKTSLLRRLHFDLTGLPPTRREVEQFRKDQSPEAFVAIVDELLSRPAFGEKWGRHWLDVARYADSNGGDRNYTFYQAWRYRNWVIDAINHDESYYDFVKAQLAGDLLPADSNEEKARGLIASTFLTLGPKMLTERDKEKLRLDTADEQLDTVGRAFLGLTIGCARCHDHKFDPVSQEDYYAMAGIFRSTGVVTGTRNGCVNVASWIERPLPVGGEIEAETTRKIERLELAMRLTVEKQFENKTGGGTKENELPFSGVIYDDTDAERIGEWTESKFSPNRFGPGYIHDDKKGKGTNKAIFRGNLPVSGEYEVRVAYNAQANRSGKVAVSIVARDGQYELILNETMAPSVGGLFEPVGRYYFEKGGDCEVTIASLGGDQGYLIVDAVQFIAVPDIDREAEALAAVAAEEGGALDPLFRMSEKELKRELSSLIKGLKDRPVAMAPRDDEASGDIHLRVRGEVSQLGPEIPRNFLKVLHAAAPPVLEEGESGRLQLAEWIVSEDNALLDRVMVNRIWHHLFGRGIVESVDNFGRLGSGPSHPELLDYLAASFRESGGSIKRLVRELVLSRCYQLSSDCEAGRLADPANKWFGRQNHRRLTAEEIRDGVLYLSGRLDADPGHDTANQFGDDLDKPISFAKERKRTVYLPVARNNPIPELAVFDAANPDMVSGKRAQTTVPTQALYLLNSEFMHKHAAVLAKLAMEESTVVGDEIDWLYQTLLSRAPDPLESQAALGLVSELSSGSEDDAAVEAALGHLAHLMLASTEYLYLD
ncbi:MAG: DUF1553 domain-containing protein [Verrucomicrobiales bacterium]|nr:DUF1553 domain-containing protein [Verrucomicrobiales bacterium]